MPSTKDRLRERRILIALAGLIALVMVSLGVLSIVDGHHVGSGRGSVLVTLDGSAARWMGAVQACLGMLVLAVVMPSKAAALRWALCWVALGLACFIAAVR